MVQDPLVRSSPPLCAPRPPYPSLTFPLILSFSDYPEWNAETQSSDPSSVLSFYRLILAMRKQYPVLIHGSYTPLSPTHAHVLSYLRACPGLGPDLLIVLNCSAEAQRWEVPKKECGAKKAELLLGTMGGEGRVEDGWMELEPWEGRIYSL